DDVDPARRRVDLSEAPARSDRQAADERDRNEQREQRVRGGDDRRSPPRAGRDGGETDRELDDPAGADHPRGHRKAGTPERSNRVRGVVGLHRARTGEQERDDHERAPEHPHHAHSTRARSRYPGAIATVPSTWFTGGTSTARRALEPSTTYRQNARAA